MVKMYRDAIRLNIIAYVRYTIFLEFLRLLSKFGYKVDVEKAKRDIEVYMLELAKTINKKVAETIIATLKAKKWATNFYMFPSKYVDEGIEDTFKYLEKIFFKEK